MCVSANPVRAPRPVCSQHVLLERLRDETIHAVTDIGRVSIDDILRLLTPPIRLISIDEICERLNRSRSWVYANIVGSDAKMAKVTPPFPWEWLPPRVPNSKSQWLASEFEQWFERVVARARAGESQGGAA
jgi:predicted DNA-binding transcriptional regulator AlpA